MDTSLLPADATLVLVARLVLGLFFLPSAVGKLVDQRRFMQGVAAYQILPAWAVPLVARLLPWLELVLALALLSGVALPVAGLATALLLLGFNGAVSLNLRRGRAIACHCHSLAGKQPINWGIVARNSLLALYALLIVAFAPTGMTSAAWLARWQSERPAFVSPGAAIMVGLLVAFGFVATQLVAGGVDVTTQVAQLTWRLSRTSVASGD